MTTKTARRAGTNFSSCRSYNAALFVAAAVLCAGGFFPAVADGREPVPGRFATDELESYQLELSVAAPAVSCDDVPLHALIELPEPWKSLPPERIAAELVELGDKPGDAGSVVGQILPGGAGRVELWWIQPRAEAGRSSRWTARLSVQTQGDASGMVTPPELSGFRWQPDDEHQTLDLLDGGLRRLRYMHAYDATRRVETYKPYHHVFDPEGMEYITKGPGGLYTHHRGIFIGWNRLTAGGKEFDLWHMTGGEQRHRMMLDTQAGPVVARSRALIHWMLTGGVIALSEVREITVLHQSGPGALLIEFASRLKAVSGPVFLNGDPEHGGFQYRAHNGVAEGDAAVKARYLFHADGIDPRKDKDLPWVAMSYGFGGRRFSVQHMNHPANPAGTVYSAYRDYGRFGAFFTKKIAAGETLSLRYRIYVAEGEMPPRAELADRFAVFADPPRVEVIR